MEGASRTWFANEAGLLGMIAAIPVHLVPDLGGDQGAAEDKFRERIRNLAVRLQIGLNVLLHGERHVGTANTRQV